MPANRHVAGFQSLAISSPAPSGGGSANRRRHGETNENTPSQLFEGDGVLRPQTQEKQPKVNGGDPRALSPVSEEGQLQNASSPLLKPSSIISVGDDQSLGGW